jgi:gluconokinase
MSKPPSSAYDQAGGMFYFPRMLDKVRLSAKGELSPDYHANLGKGADGWCCNFLRIDYPALQERVLAGGGDEEILEWCFASGRRLNEHDIWVWNQCMSRIGWRDAASRRLEQVKAGSGLAGRQDIVTMMDYFDVDEGRKP